MEPNFNKMSVSEDIYQLIKNSADRVVPNGTIVPTIDLETFRHQMELYVNGIPTSNQQDFNFAKITARTTTNKRNSNHYFNLFRIFFIKSLKETHPDKIKDIEEFEKKIIELQKSLYKTLKGDKVDSNDSFIPMLLGITDGLI